MFCGKCGTENTEGAGFCKSCGAKLVGTTATVAGLTRRDPIMVLVLSVITFGIYGIYWMVKTSWELNEAGADIPTAWLIIIPIISIWWLWKVSEGVELVTQKEMTAVMAFILLYLLGMIGGAIVQNTLNNYAE